MSIPEGGLKSLVTLIPRGKCEAILRQGGVTGPFHNGITKRLLIAMELYLERTVSVWRTDSEWKTYIRVQDGNSSPLTSAEHKYFLSEIAQGIFALVETIHFAEVVVNSSLSNVPGQASNVILE